MCHYQWYILVCKPWFLYVHVHTHSICWLGSIIYSTRKHGYLLLKQNVSISMPSIYGIFSVIVLKKFITFLSSIKDRKVNKALRFPGVYWKRPVPDRDCSPVLSELAGHVGPDVPTLCADQQPPHICDHVRAAGPDPTAAEPRPRLHAPHQGIRHRFNSVTGQIVKEVSLYI